MRQAEEWVGATDDTPCPPRVKIRIFERDKGICHISGRKIMPGELWDAEHIIAICNGGQNRESNLAPALRSKHREKTAEDVAEKSLIARKRKKHLLKRQSTFRPAPPGYSHWAKRIER